MWDILNPLLLTSQDLVVLAAIGNPEAATYRNSFAYMSILLIAIALGFLVMMIGFRAKQAQREQSPHMSRTDSSNWIATKPFLIGWGIAVLGAYFIVTTLLRVISYYARMNDPEYPVEVRWCYECSGWEWALGPELSIVVGTISLAGLVIGIIMVTTRGRRTLNQESR